MKRPLRNRRCHRAASVVGCWLILAALWLSFNGCLLWAQPVGQTVVAGQATFERQGALTTIRAGNNSIINYRSFDILANHTVQFIQPDASSRVLNRVIGDGPTSIFGNLLANGQVYIANPAGIYFGKGAYVNVGGLFAAAGRISDQDFMNHINRVTGMNGDVANLGTIEAGSISLAGQHVSNQGYLTSRNGLVTLLAGDEVLMGESGGSVFVNLGKTAPATGTGVENTGTIKAGSGRSILAAGDLYSLAVANSGTIEAREITLEGKGAGKVQASGTLNASDRSIGGVGGKIEVLGEKVAVSGAKIDASGDAGGGTVLVGGDFRGKGESRNASFTLVDRDSSIKADAISSGDGGKVAVWSDDTTDFHGTISAQAFGQTGDGGFAEISGKQHLALSGHANLSAANGANGHLLIDPGSVTIRGGTNPPSASKDIFTDGWIIDQLNFGTDLTISTADSADSKAQDLTVDNTATIAYNSSTSLTLIGNNSVTINGLINNSGYGDVTISGGQIKINAPVTLRLDVSGNRQTPTVTLDGAVIGDGRVTANTLNLIGNGNVGSASQRLNTTVNSITLNRTGGDSYIDQTGVVGLFGVTGNGSLDLRASSAITVTQGSIVGAVVAGINAGSGDVTLSSADDINFGDITAKSLSAHSGTDGTGNINFSGGRISTRILADFQSYQAGDGTGGANKSFVQFHNLTGDPTFLNASATKAPDRFTHQQDAAINDPDIAAVAQFASPTTGVGSAPALYTIRSDDGAVTVSTPVNVNGSALTLWANRAITIGGVLDLSALDATADSIVLNAPGAQVPSVKTSVSHVYHGAVTLAAPTVLEGACSCGVTFDSTVDGPFSLEVNTSGTTTFKGAVGSKAPLASVTTDAGGTTDLNGGSVTSSGAQAYHDPVTLTANSILTGVGVAFDSTVDRDNAARDLTVYAGTGAATFAGNIGGGPNGALGALAVNSSGATTFGGIINAARLSTDAGGTTALNGKIVNAGVQDYQDDVTLGSDTVLNGTTVTFGKTLNADATANNRILQVNASGVTTFGGPVGDKAPLASLTTDAAGTTDLNGGPVSTSGSQTYNDDTILSADTILTGTTIRFNGMVNGASSGGQSLTINGDAIFGNGAGDFVGNAASLHFLTVSGSTTLNGGATGGNTITTAHGQTYGGAATLGADTVLATTSDGDISFNSTVDGAHSLQVNTSGATIFGGAVNLASVTTDAGGRTDLNGGTVTTSGSQTYYDPVTLTANMKLTGVGVAFNSTVDRDSAARDLTVNAGTGAGTFAANIGAGPNGALGALAVNSSGITTFGGSVNAASVTTDAGGRTDLNGGSVTTSGDQTYGDTVTLGASTILNGTRLGLAAVDGGGNNLRLDNRGLATLNGPVNGVNQFAATGNGTLAVNQALSAGSVNDTEATMLSGGTVTTLASQAYGNTVTLGANTVLNGTTLGLAAVNGGGNDLTLNNSGLGALNGAVSGVNRLNATGSDRLEVHNAISAGSINDTEATTLSGGTVTTLAGQTYGNTVTLGADATLEGTSLTLAGVVGNNYDFTLNFSGLTDLNGANVTGIKNLATGNGGITRLSGNLTTSGSQTYGDDVKLGADTTLTGITMTFKGTVNGTTTDTESLAINGNAVFGDGPGDFVGNETSLKLLTVSGTTAFNGGSTGANTVTTAHSQTYDGAVTLGGATVLASTLGGDILFNSTVNGAQSLQVNAAGTTSFNGPVGQGVRLASVTTDAAGTTVIGGGVVQTTGDQIYKADKLQLIGSTVLESSGGDIRFNPDGNTADSESATIFQTSPGNITIRAKNFAMGQNDKFVSTGGGGITIEGSIAGQASDSARLSDIAALGDIRINSSDIKLLQRKPVTSQSLDRGLDFVGTTISVGPGIPTFAGDPAAEPKAVFGTTDGLANVPLANGIVRTHIDPPPFAPVFDPNGVPLDPHAPIPLNISEALGLVEPVPFEEAAQVVVSPAFMSYENLFSSLYLLVFELQNTLGTRNAEAARLLDQMQTDIEYLRQEHRDWAANDDSQEHNPEAFWRGLDLIRRILTRILDEPNDSVSVPILKSTAAPSLKLGADQVRNSTTRRKWDGRHVEVIVEIFKNQIPADDYVTYYVSTGDVFMQEIERSPALQFPRTKAGTSSKLVYPADYYFWALGAEVRSGADPTSLRRYWQGPYRAEGPRYTVRLIVP